MILREIGIKIALLDVNISHLRHKIQHGNKKCTYVNRLIVIYKREPLFCIVNNPILHAQFAQ